ncbi:MAG: response regulator [Treponema sp.]|nr:response regulator [Treponema sp.]
MFAPEIYIIADSHRLVIQSMIRDFKEADAKINLIDPDIEQVKLMPDGPINVILSISDSLSFGILKYLHNRVIKTGTHLFLVGKKQGLSIDEERILKTTPAAVFESYPLDIVTIMNMVEWNSRLRKRILIVDDEPMILKTIKSWLVTDYDVNMVTSGFAALDYLNKYPVDLVLLDYEMPGLSGPDVLSKIRFQNETKNLAVIFLTAKDDKSSVMNALEQKPDGYMLKTQSPDDLRKNLSDFFKRYVVRL